MWTNTLTRPLMGRFISKNDLRAKVRTGFGKTDRPGSQGGCVKRDDGSRAEAHSESLWKSQRTLMCARSNSIPTICKSGSVRGVIASSR